MTSPMNGPARPPKPGAIQCRPRSIDHTLDTEQHHAPLSDSDCCNSLTDSLRTLTEVELQELLGKPALLDALYYAQHHLPGERAQTLARLEQELEQTRTAISSLRQQVVEKRIEVENSIIETKELEKEWESAELSMYASLKAFSSSTLFARLKAVTTEAEKTSDTLETSFLEGSPLDQNDGIQGFIKEYRSARKSHHLRNEKLARWKDGRVGGFR